MSVRDRVVGQFKKPSGPFGHIVGWIMAARGSNRGRSRWTIDLLHIGPDDRVLELGCGPGVALEQVARRLLSGTILGIDHSPVMVKQAARRNREAIAAGRVLLRAGTIEDVRAAGSPFTKIFSVNVIQFVPDKAAFFRLLHTTLVLDERAICSSSSVKRWDQLHLNTFRAAMYARPDCIELKLRGSRQLRNSSASCCVLVAE
jgi:trans-aconitate methyltransferase